MPKFLERFTNTSVKRKTEKLPSVEVKRKQIRKNLLPPINAKTLPNASVIYGSAAAILMTIGLYFLFTGAWLSGILLFLPAGCLLGFALHYLRFFG